MKLLKDCLKMEPQDIGIGGSSSGRTARNRASLRQQQDEFRRRLMRPNRVPRSSDGYPGSPGDQFEDQFLDHPGDPVRNGGPQAAEAAELFAALNDGSRPDLQWAYGESQGLLHFYVILYRILFGSLIVSTTPIPCYLPS